MPRTSSRSRPSATPKPDDTPNICREPKTEPLSGLYIFGRISDRARRTIPTRDLSSAEIVTYTVEDSIGHKYYVDEYSPAEYHEVGESVELPVYVKTYKKRNGDIGHSFCIQQQYGIPSRGERF